MNNTAGFAFAQTVEDTSGVSDTATASDATIQQQADQLQTEVNDRVAKIKSLEGSIGSYTQKIADQEQQSLTLENQTVLLENRIQEKQFAFDKAKTEVELTNLQIQQLDVGITQQQKTIDQHRLILEDLLRRIRQDDGVHPLQALLTGSSLSAYMSQLDELQRIQAEMVDATKELHTAKTGLEATRKEQDARRTQLLAQEDELQRDQITLQEERSAKLSLLATTQDSEAEFQRVVSELRSQQEEERSTVNDLQSRLHDQLDQTDTLLAHGEVLFQWPLIPKKGISAKFHDPNYPFRHLFEHPGVDLPTDVGTPVHAAAGGYVAGTRTGKQYGNYIMLVHAGGIATVYAHLSRFAVRPDTYVQRGDIIGFSGGRPGDEGAGLSTGAHLHFEVRQGGIPVNPENFLPELTDGVQ